MRKRTLWSAALATAVAALLPLTALAKQWDDVDTWDKLADAFADTDADVTIILTGDITFANALEAKQGQTYVINGHEYTLTNVSFNGGGKVEVTAKEVKGDGKAALRVSENADVTVNGPVNGKSEAVLAYDDAKVTVEGDVSSEHSGVSVGDNANVTVNGNVTGGSAGDAVLVATEDKGNVTVNGNVVADDTNSQYGSFGVKAAEDSKVTVTGDVKGGNATAEGTAIGGEGVLTGDNAQVTVGGSVTGGSADAQLPSATPTATGTAPLPEAHGAPGVVMESTAKVEVKGDVKGGNATAKEGIAYAGDGGYIILSLKTDDPDAKQAGRLVVQGSVQGGVSTGLIGHDGAGLFYQFPETPDGAFVAEPFWNGDFFYPTYADISKAIAAEKTEDMTDGTFSFVLIELHGDMVISALLNGGILENRDAADDMLDKILADFMSKLMEKYPQLLDVSSGDEFLDFIDQLPADEAAKLWDLYLEALRPIVDPYAQKIGSDALKSAILPTVSIWGVKGGGDQAAVLSSVSLDVANLLNADVDYMIRVLPVENGTLSVDKQTAKPGETVTVTATPNQGYQVSKVMVSGEAISGKNGVYTFTMPDHGFVEVSGEFVSGAPKTGDNSQSALWVAALLLAAGAFLVVKRHAKA